MSDNSHSHDHSHGHHVQRASATTCMRYILSQQKCTCSCPAIPLCVYKYLTTRLNNSMIMVHLIRSLLTNLNSMIDIEAKYVELCKYNVTYVGLNFLQSSAVAEGPRNACRSDLCQSWRWVVWWFRCTPIWARIGRFGAFGRGGGAPFARKFRMERVSPYQPFLAWSVSGLSSAVEPPDAPIDVPLPCQWRQSFRIPRCVASGRQRFDNRCCFE